MSKRNTLARPYAKAAFEYAREHHVLDKWSEMLQKTKEIIQYPRVFALLNDPRIERHEFVKLLKEVNSELLDQAGQHLIELLSDNRRLNVLPQIADLYESLKSDYKKIMDVRVVSAFTLSDQEQESLAKALKIRLQREVSLSCEVEKSLLGGAIVYAGDLVIDGSVKGKINRLVNELTL